MRSNTAAAVPGEVPAQAPGGFEVEYTAEDGARLRVPLSDAAPVLCLLDAAITPVIDAHKNLTILIGGKLIKPPGTGAPYQALEQLTEFNGFDIGGLQYQQTLCYIGSSSHGDPYAATIDPSTNRFTAPLSNTVNVYCSPVEIIDQQGPTVV